MRYIFPDADHSVDQAREIIIGHSSQQHLLLVRLTERQAAIRLIRARRAPAKEQYEYEDGIINLMLTMNDDLRPE